MGVIVAVSLLALVVTLFVLSFQADSLIMFLASLILLLFFLISFLSNYKTEEKFIVPKEIAVTSSEVLVKTPNNEWIKSDKASVFLAAKDSANIFIRDIINYNIYGIELVRKQFVGLKE